MSKGIKFLMAFFIMMIALPFGANVVKADDNELDLDEGEYTIDFDALHAKEDKPSGVARFIEKPALLEVNSDKIFLTLEVVHETVTGFQVENNDELIEPKDNNISEDGKKRFITYELDKFPQMMIAQVQYVAGSHSGDQPLRLSFDLDSLEKQEDESKEDPKEDPKEEPNPEQSEKELTIGELDSVKANQIITLAGESGFQLTMPKDLPNDVELKVTKVNKAKNTGKFLEVAGQVYEFDFDGLGSFDGKFELTMTYDNDKYDADDVDIYYYNESKKKWEAQNGEAKDGTVTVTVDHFSTYGVLANVITESLLKPDKAYEIDYTILHEDGTSPSISNDFFKKPALLFEKDGNKYVHLTIENGDMIKSLSNKFGNILVVKENDDGSKIVQLRVNNDLSNIDLDMHIVVPAGAIPGFPGYDEKHGAILVFDKDSKKEIEIGGHMLVGTNNPENKNGPFVEDGSSNELGKGDDKKEKIEQPTNSNPDKDLNPKTGDTNNIAFYVFLLVSSLISLGFLVRKRQLN